VAAREDALDAYAATPTAAASAPASHPWARGAVRESRRLWRELPSLDTKSQLALFDLLPATDDPGLAAATDGAGTLALAADDLDDGIVYWLSEHEGLVGVGREVDYGDLSGLGVVRAVVVSGDPAAPSLRVATLERGDPADP
ncbi:MAG: hypothetical protein CVU56_18375, partial [Deltaproteobacteria bacterium HGW-Deltaproteobacteria-14]